MLNESSTRTGLANAWRSAFRSRAATRFALFWMAVSMIAAATVVSGAGLGRARPDQHSDATLLRRVTYLEHGPGSARTTPVTARATAVSAGGRCKTTAKAGFVPHQIAIRGVVRRAPVLAVGRRAGDVPGTPPVNSYGKRVFAWDAPGVRPGSRRGNVLVNAHTWPDGSALGNRLLGRLYGGAVVRVVGSSKQACYRVTQRLYVPADRAPLGRIYNAYGSSHLVIIVCSGRRLGPGRWSHRTVWFANPVAQG
jgi:hypothetical protein